MTKSLGTALGKRAELPPLILDVGSGGSKILSHIVIQGLPVTHAIVSQNVRWCIENIRGRDSKKMQNSRGAHSSCGGRALRNPGGEDFFEGGWRISGLSYVVRVEWAPCKAAILRDPVHHDLGSVCSVW
jgi:hypothetical protein